jgi:hypothetical protein
MIFCAISEGQSENIVADIENMVRSYIEKVRWLLCEGSGQGLR